MKLGLSIKIDVTKIDKSRLFKGEKGTYLDLTTFIDLENPSEYGDHGFISQTVSKEEREQNIQTPILGNSKVFFTGKGQPAQGGQQGNSVPQSQAAPASGGVGDFDGDIPFARPHDEYFG